jgi:uncharacterized membrane protein YtjA (UPF0391 family)
MMRLPFLFFIAAVIAAILGFSGVAESAGGVAIVLFLVFGVLFVLTVVFGGARRTVGGVAGGFGGVLALAAVALLAVWFSDNYSLETAGSRMDETLADARETLGEVADDLPGAARDAREEIADALDDAEEVVEPEPESEVESAPQR